VHFRGLARSACAALWLSLGLGPLACNLISADRGAGPNVLLVTIDTLRADRVGAYGARDVATPTLDGLAARGVLFEEAMASVPLTLPSHTSIMTGQYPPTHGVRHNAVFVLPNDAETIAERFSEAGYATGAVVGAAVLDSGYGLEQGFDSYDAEMAKERSTAAGFFERPANEVTDHALAWLADSKRPFFLWVHYYDVHAAHNPPEPFKTRFQTHLYDGEAAYVDQELGRLLAALEQKKLLANTIVAVTADHGEGLGEHGEESHTYFVYDSVLHVPLMLAGPGVPVGKRVKPVTPNTGIAATLLALAGLSPLHKTDVGDLAPLWREGATGTAGEAYAESLAGELDHGWAPLHAIRTDRYHYIRAPRPELYDLESDPHELKNLLPSKQAEPLEIVKSDESRIDALLADSADLKQVAVDAETRKRVEALGYVVPDGKAVKTGADPKDVYKLAGLGFDVLALSFAKRYDEAEKLALKGLELMPDSSQIHDTLARVYLETSRPALALPHAQAAARLSPGIADYRGQLAYVYLVLGDLPNAVAAFDEVLRLDPEHPGGHVGAMWRVKLGGSIAEAEEHARQALANDGNHPEFPERVGEVWEALGEYDRALAVFEQGAKDYPNYPNFHMRLAIQYARLGDEERAEAERAAAGAAGDNVNLRNRLAIAYAARRDFEHAEPIFRAILAERPEERSTKRFLARMLRETGRTSEADKLVEGVPAAAEALPPEPPTETPARG